MYVYLGEDQIVPGYSENGLIVVPSPSQELFIQPNNAEGIFVKHSEDDIAIVTEYWDKTEIEIRGKNPSKFSLPYRYIHGGFIRQNFVMLFHSENLKTLPIAFDKDDEIISVNINFAEEVIVDRREKIREENGFIMARLMTSKGIFDTPIFDTKVMNDL